MTFSTLKFGYLNVNERKKGNWKYLKVEYVKCVSVTMPSMQVEETASR
jgi:hypothetical protein